MQSVLAVFSARRILITLLTGKEDLGIVAGNCSSMRDGACAGKQSAAVVCTLLGHSSSDSVVLYDFSNTRKAMKGM